MRLPLSHTRCVLEQPKTLFLSRICGALVVLETLLVVHIHHALSCYEVLAPGREHETSTHFVESVLATELVKCNCESAVRIPEGHIRGFPSAQERVSWKPIYCPVSAILLVWLVLHLEQRMR